MRESQIGIVALKLHYIGIFRQYKEIKVRVIKISATNGVGVGSGRFDTVGRFTVCEDFEVHQPDLEKRGHKFS